MTISGAVRDALRLGAIGYDAVKHLVLCRLIIDELGFVPLSNTGAEPVPGDDLAAAADDHLMDIATDPDLPVTIGDGYRIIVTPVADQGERVDPRCLFVASIIEDRWQRHQYLLIILEPFADAFPVAAQNIALPLAALFLQVDIEGLPTGNPGDRHHEVPSCITDQPFHLALVITLAGTSITILEQVM